MKILNLQEVSLAAAIEAAVFVLRAGGIVIYPTETTYGVAVDVENPAAVDKLLEYKGKRDGKPISVAVADIHMAERYVSLNATAERVYQTFLPGPVTVVSTGTGKTAVGIASTEGKVGIRIPKHDLALDLIRAYGSGISATGANASNQKRPYAIQDILDNISVKQKDLIDLILDIGELPHNEPSTVIDTTIDDIVVLRQGKELFRVDETVTTQSPEETMEVFHKFARRWRSYYTYTPVLFLFSGEMGAGKTHAIKGLASGLGIEENLTSPTYTLAQEYRFENESRPCQFVHIDCWRMRDFRELLDIGLENYIEENAVLAIEWSERFANFAKYAGRAKLITITIQSGLTESERIFKFSLGTDS